jgi:hypothetical protein
LSGLSPDRNVSPTLTLEKGSVIRVRGKLKLFFN